MRRKNFNKRARFRAGAARRGASTLRGPCSCHGIIGERRNTRSLRFYVRCPMQMSMCISVGTRLLPITSGRLSLWLIHIMPKAQGRRRAPPCDSHRDCGWVHGETHATFQNRRPWRAEWSAGDYRGIITPALCTCDLCLICN